MSDRYVKLSKTLSYWLRHRPDEAGVTLDPEGWTSVDGVLTAFERENLACDWAVLVDVVENNNKQRFELSADASRIRARQGHSVAVTLDWPQRPPPDLLYHGTVDRFLPAILAEGLKPMARHHVHLSPDVDTARRVGARRGQPVILRIDAGTMASHGHAFFLTANGVWLAERVPPDFLFQIA